MLPSFWEALIHVCVVMTRISQFRTNVKLCFGAFLITAANRFYCLSHLKPCMFYMLWFLINDVSV